jgi:HAD superfamily hydrolase (TIGR01509 family)
MLGAYMCAAMMTSPSLSIPAEGGIVFDMDGLMLDTERIARIAWRKAAILAGHEMSDDLFASLIGRREPDSSEILRRAFGPGFDFAKANAQCNLLYHEYLAEHGLPLKPGVRELLDALTQRRVRLAVATSTQNPIARLRLEQAGLLGSFSAVVAGDEIVHGKPAPDIYLEAVRRLGIDASVSFALEDSFAGVRSAHAAGLKVIMVPDILQPTPEIRALTWSVDDSLHDVRLRLGNAA